MFLYEYSLSVKRDEIRKLEEKSRAREDELQKFEKKLEDQAAKFDAFLKENNLKTMEGTRRADSETKIKLEKVQDIKRLNNEIASIKNELAKYDEQLEDCKRYKEFLDKLTPSEWLDEWKTVSTVSSSEMVNFDRKIRTQKNYLCTLMLPTNFCTYSKSWKRTICSWCKSVKYRSTNSVFSHDTAGERENFGRLKTEKKRHRRRQVSYINIFLLTYRLREEELNGFQEQIKYLQNSIRKQNEKLGSLGERSK
jgi:hypothetical protein